MNKIVSIKFQYIESFCCILWIQLPEKTLLYAIEDGRAGATDYFVIDPITGVITIDTRLSEDTARPPDYVVCTWNKFKYYSLQRLIPSSLM